MPLVILDEEDPFIDPGVVIRDTFTDLEKQTMKVLFYHQRHRVENPDTFAAHFNADRRAARAALNNNDDVDDGPTEEDWEWSTVEVARLLAWVIRDRNFVVQERRARPSIGMYP